MSDSLTFDMRHITKSACGRLDNSVAYSRIIVHFLRQSPLITVAHAIQYIRRRHDRLVDKGKVISWLDTRRYVTASSPPVAQSHICERLAHASPCPLENGEVWQRAVAVGFVAFDPPRVLKTESQSYN